MQINEKLYKELLECNWLENCGTTNFNNHIVKTKYENLDNLYIKNIDNQKNIGIYLIKDKEQAIKYISSIKWENLCLDVRGYFTEFLAVNVPDKYNMWNIYVSKLKSDYLPPIEESIRLILEKKNYPESFFDDIMFNIVTIFMLDIYSEYYHDNFFENMLQIYLSGHLVCCWYGKYPKGKFIVY